MECKKAMAKTTGPKPATKSEVMTKLAEGSGLSKKEVQAVFDALGGMIKEELGKKGPGVFTIPGLLKLTVQRQ